jgi:hypothetical protein
VNNELEGMWKEAVVAQFVTPSRNFLGESKENHENSQDRWYPVLHICNSGPEAV